MEVPSRVQSIECRPENVRAIALLAIALVDFADLIEHYDPDLALRARLLLNSLPNIPPRSCRLSTNFYCLDTDSGSLNYSLFSSRYYQTSHYLYSEMHEFL